MRIHSIAELHRKSLCKLINSHATDFPTRRNYTRSASSGEAPVIPLPTFPSMIKMPTLRQEEEYEVAAPTAENEYSGEDYTLG